MLELSDKHFKTTITIMHIDGMLNTIEVNKRQKLFLEKYKLLKVPNKNLRTKIPQYLK